MRESCSRMYRKFRNAASSRLHHSLSCLQQSLPRLRQSIPITCDTRGIRKLARAVLKAACSKAALLLLILAVSYFGNKAWMMHKEKIEVIKEQERAERDLEECLDLKESVEFGES